MKIWTFIKNLFLSVPEKIDITVTSEDARNSTDYDDSTNCAVATAIKRQFKTNEVLVHINCICIKGIWYTPTIKFGVALYEYLLYNDNKIVQFSLLRAKDSEEACYNYYKLVESK
jgi:hypothetical protein